jgi:hypothetical protein
MTTSTTSITPDLICYMANASTSPIPSQVLVKAKNHVLDTIAAMVSGVIGTRLSIIGNRLGSTHSRANFPLKSS